MIIFVVISDFNIFWIYLLTGLTPYSISNYSSKIWFFKESVYVILIPWAINLKYKLFNNLDIIFIGASFVIELNIIISSILLKNSGLNFCFSNNSTFLIPSFSFERRNSLPKLYVLIIIIFLQSKILLCKSDNLPLSIIWSNSLNKSWWAF